MREIANIYQNEIKRNESKQIRWICTAIFRINGSRIPASPLKFTIENIKCFFNG